MVVKIQSAVKEGKYDLAQEHLRETIQTDFDTDRSESIYKQIRGIQAHISNDDTKDLLFHYLDKFGGKVPLAKNAANTIISLDGLGDVETFFHNKYGETPNDNLKRHLQSIEAILVTCLSERFASKTK
jgi:phosphosulfolactate synthase (CoM biosynthesis protein A)